jgi:hypothetical protein
MTTTTPTAPSADVNFYFDPVCPFAWMTSKWLRMVTAQRKDTVERKSISLRLINAEIDYDTPHPARLRRWAHRRAAPAARGGPHPSRTRSRRRRPAIPSARGLPQRPLTHTDLCTHPADGSCDLLVPAPLVIDRSIVRARYVSADYLTGMDPDAIKAALATLDWPERQCLRRAI